MEHVVKKVDIIVPIYNAYEHLVKCVDSIFKYTDLSSHRLILLNDNSSDERVAAYLENMLRHQNVYVKNNEANIGFSANINQGIDMSSNDVILLNSDTVVTKRWLEKIQDCAYRDPMIATVTPLSNAATIYSVPDFCEDNNLPSGITIDRMAELVEESSLHLYPETPVAHGFCMYIKREVVDLIGGFDAETFKKGYGEENDFCYRAEEIGYHHVMCDDTFIYHAGTASFSSKEKEKLIREHKDYLFKQYPYQMKKTEDYCKDNLNHRIQDNIKFRIKIEQIVANGKRNILYQLQSTVDEDGVKEGGGVQLHVKDLVESLKEQFNIIVAARNEKWLDVTVYSDADRVKLKFYIGSMPAYTRLCNSQIQSYYRSIFTAFKVDMVHVHHTYGIGLDIYYVAHELKVPIITTIHDYYCVCPKMNLLDNTGEVCTNKTDGDRCKKCLNGIKINPSLNYIDWWRKKHESALKLSNLIIAPSNSTKKILSKYYPKLNDNIQVISHGVVPLKAYRNSEKKNKKFNVAFLGSVGNPIKGGEIISELIEKGSKEIQWYVFGSMGHCRLNLLDRENYVKAGPYRREDLSKILMENQIDLIGILSICPETYCYTLSESVLCGIPVIAFDIGAVGERMREYGCGWLMKSQRAEDILELIDQIRTNRENYTKVKMHLEQIHIKTIEEMAMEYKDLYMKYAKPVVRLINADSKMLFGAYIGKIMDEGSEKRLEEVEKQIQRIENSIAYKISLKLVELHVPGKQYLMSILYKIYSLKRK